MSTMHAPVSTGATYTVGDRLPPIKLRDPTGATVDLSHQTLAGNTILLWVTGPEPDPGIAAALTAAAGDLLALAETIVFAVTPEGAIDGIATLCDPEARIARSVGLTCPGIVLLGPNRRLVAVLPEVHDLEQAMSVCARLYNRTAERVVRMQPPALIVPDVLDRSLCGRLIAFWEKSEKLPDGVAVSDGTARQSNRFFKRRADVPLIDPVLFEEVSRCIVRRVRSAIQLAFQRIVTRCETVRIGCYESADQGAFARHRDNSTRYTAHRLFAMSLNLNDDYTGGEVRFPEYGRAVFRPDAGGALIFSCALLHEALPVRSGRRFGLFTFIYDEEGAEQERRMIDGEKAAGRDPTTPYPVVGGTATGK